MRHVFYVLGSLGMVLGVSIFVLWCLRRWIQCAPGSRLGCSSLCSLRTLPQRHSLKPLASWGALCLVSCMLLAQGWMGADLPCGLLWILVFKLCVYAMRPGPEGALEILCCVPVFGMVFMGVGLAASGFNCSQVVHAQAGGITHWLMGPLWPAAYAWMVYTAMEPMGGSRKSLRVVLDQGADAGLWMSLLAQYAHIVINVSMFSFIFLGGWLSPVDQWWGCAWINRWMPGCVWWLIKTAGTLWVCFWFRARLSGYGAEERMRVMWKLCLPLASCAFLCLAAVKALGYALWGGDIRAYTSLVYLSLGGVDCLRSGVSVFDYSSLVPLRTVRWIRENIHLNPVGEGISLASEIVFTPQDKVVYKSASTESVPQGALCARDE